MNGRFLLIALLSFSMTTLWMHACQAAEPLAELVDVRTTAGATVVGELKQEDSKKFDVIDLKSGKEVTIDKDDVRRIYRNVSENAALQSVGLSALLTWKINKSLPVLSGRGAIAKVSGSVIYVSLGAKAGIGVGDKLTVFRGETELTDPASGEVLGKERRKIGNLEITEVRDKFCKAKQLGELEIDLEAGDVVEPVGFNNALAIVPFVDLEGSETTYGRQVSEELTTGLVKRGITVVERSRFADVLSELVVQQTGLFDAQTAQQLGKQIGAYAILTGTIVPKDKNNGTDNRLVEAQVRLIEVKTGKILLASSYKTKGSTEPVPNTAPVVRVSQDAAPKADIDPPADKPQGAPQGRKLPTITNSIGMKLALIPAGQFVMGAPATEKGNEADETHQHPVRISKQFYMGVHEVTQAEYQRIMGDNPSGFQGAKLPVENVSWDDAQAFCRKLSEKEGKKYRLPTEAEWEYACRAGSKSAYHFGDNVADLNEYAWYDANSGRTTHAVGTRKPSNWGLYDMHGNVCEWCSDWYGANYYSTSPASDPKGPDVGTLRVFRPGAWDDNPVNSCRSASRSYGEPALKRNVVGFRIVLER